MAKPALRIDLGVRVNRLPAIGSKARREIGAAVRSRALRAVATAKVNAPVDTGFHRASIGMRAGDHDLHALVYSGSGYGLPLERGTRRMAKRPHIEPAVREEAAALEGDVAEAMTP